MKINPTQMHHDLQAGKKLLVIDVRMFAEFCEVHIDGSLSMPIDTLDADVVKQMAHDVDACVITCFTGKRAEVAYKHLTQLGCEHLLLLDGGLEEWMRLDLPVKREEAVTVSIMRQVQWVVGLGFALGATLALTVNPWFLVLPAFFGASLALSGITGHCFLCLLISKMPWNRVSPVGL